MSKLYNREQRRKQLRRIGIEIKTQPEQVRFEALIQESVKQGRYISKAENDRYREWLKKYGNSRFFRFMYKIFYVLNTVGAAWDGYLQCAKDNGLLPADMDLLRERVK